MATLATLIREMSVLEDELDLDLLRKHVLAHGRLKESGSEGQGLKETQAINKSLFTLGQVPGHRPP